MIFHLRDLDLDRLLLLRGLARGLDTFRDRRDRRDRDLDLDLDLDIPLMRVRDLLRVRDDGFFAIFLDGIPYE